MKIAPSILTADFTNLAEDIRSVESADYLHIDIMDGHFVPNISFGPAITQQISKVSSLPLDVHLMVTNPVKWIDLFAKSKPQFITIHTEANRVEETIKSILSHHIGLGLSIKPKTPIDDLLPFLDQASLVLIMTVEPGFGGQSFIFEALDKVKELVKIRKANNYNFEIEVDGGINDETIKNCRDAGVDIVVAGSYLFNRKDREKGIASLR